MNPMHHAPAQGPVRQDRLYVGGEWLDPVDGRLVGLPPSPERQPVRRVSEEGPGVEIGGGVTQGGQQVGVAGAVPVEETIRRRPLHGRLFTAQGHPPLRPAGRASLLPALGV